MAATYARTTGIQDPERKDTYLFADSDVRDFLETGESIPRLSGENPEITVEMAQETLVHPMMKKSAKTGVGSVERTETEGREYPVGRDVDGKMSVNVPWQNTTYNDATQNQSGLMSAEDKKYLDGLDGTISGIENSLKSMLGEFLKSVYPVGSIYMSTSNTNPGDLFNNGTLWMEWGRGRVPVGVDPTSSYDKLRTVESDGGYSNNTLIKHTHGMSAATIGEAGGEQTVSLSIQESGKHEHSHTTLSNVNQEHSHNVSLSESSTHSHGPGTLAAISSTPKAGTAVANLKTDGNLSGILGYRGVAKEDAVRNTEIGDRWDADGRGAMVGATAEAGNHTHASSVSAALGTHTHTIVWDASDGGHTHTGTAKVSFNHTHTMSGASINDAGTSDGTNANYQPFVTCYMWKRVA